MLSELTAALRALARARGYTVSVVLILSLGLGSATAVFTMVEASILPQPTNIADPTSLVRIELSDPKRGYSGMIAARFYLNAIREAKPRSIGELAGKWGDENNLVLENQISSVYLSRVTANYFSFLGVTPTRGRSFLPEDEKAEGLQPVILSDYFWRTTFGADESALGRVIQLGERKSVIVGILGSELRLPMRLSGHLFVPYSVSDFAATSPDITGPLEIYARLASGHTMTAAEAELRALRLASPQPEARFYDDKLPTIVAHDAERNSPGGGKYRLKNWAMLGAVGLIYVIACVNAANLMLVRTLDRRRELGVRCALGGSQWLVMRPVLLESALLALASTLLGFAVAKWLFSLLLALTPAAAAPWEPLQLSERSLLLMLGLGGLASLLLTFVLLWQTMRLDIQAALKSGGHAGSSLAGSAVRHTFVVIQTALAAALLICTGLMVRTCQNLLADDPGFIPGGKLLVRVSSPINDPTQTTARRERNRRVLEAVAALPGIASVGLTNGFPYGGGMQRRFRAHGAKDGAAEITLPISAIGPQFFSTLGLPLLLGGHFPETRPGAPPVCILSDSLARQFFPGENPIGRKLVTGREPPLEIIGVVGDIRRVREPNAPRVYVPEAQERFVSNSSYLLVRLRSEASPQFEAEVRRAVYAVEPRLVVGSITKLERYIINGSHNERSALINLQALGTLALALSAFGLFAMMNYSVAQRRAEFGVRFALGATSEDLQRLVLRQGLSLVTLGLVLGIALAWFLARSFSVLLYETPPLDLPTNTVVAVLLLATALLACWLPVRRATRIDLARLLRTE